MPCIKPLRLYATKDGRYLANRPSGHSGSGVTVGCRQCLSCRLDKVAEWVLRATHENTLHNSSQFVTLTYDDDHLPENMNLQYTDVQLFHKRLRKYYKDQKIRFILSGEYGDITSRPHYHSIYFGLEVPTDAEILRKTRRDEPVYKSETLTNLWGKGYAEIGTCTPQSIAYVAGYTTKDLSSGLWKNDYAVLDETTGEYIKRRKPFISMSRRPGIGKGFLDKFHSDIFPSGQCLTNTGKLKAAPNYYLNLLKKSDPVLYDQLKLERSDSVLTKKHRADNTPARRAVKQTCRLAKMNMSAIGGSIRPVNLKKVVNG